MCRTTSWRPPVGATARPAQGLERVRAQPEGAAAGGELAVRARDGARLADAVRRGDLHAHQLAPVVLVDEAGDARVAERAVGDAARVQEREHEARRELVQVQQHLGRAVAVDRRHALRRHGIGEADVELEPERLRQRVLLPRRAGGAVAIAAPQVHDLAPVAVDRARRADLVAVSIDDMSVVDV
jgi:hypothetical protein